MCILLKTLQHTFSIFYPFIHSLYYLSPATARFLLFSSSFQRMYMRTAVVVKFFKLNLTLCSLYFLSLHTYMLHVWAKGVKKISKKEEWERTEKFNIHICCKKVEHNQKFSHHCQHENADNIRRVHFERKSISVEYQNFMITSSKDFIMPPANSIFLTQFPLPTHICIADKPICRSEQKRIYGVARNEAAEILCEVDAYPPPDSFKWSFNNTAETFEMPQSDYRIHSSRASSLSYTPVKVRLLWGISFCALS